MWLATASLAARVAVAFGVVPVGLVVLAATTPAGDGSARSLDALGVVIPAAAVALLAAHVPCGLMAATTERSGHGRALRSPVEDPPESQMLRELETTVRSALTDIIDAAEEAVPNGPRAGAIVVPT